MADQMRTEVEVLSQVHHVNIVQLMGWSKDGMAPCLVYAFMEGGSLQDRLACRGSGALLPLTANERILVLSDVARGLAYLHSEVRVIHRDVKSANVLLDRGCQGRIGDFGISKSLNDNNAGITSTHMHTEHVMGTQVYMAPEYKNGELSTKVDAFAFGLVVLETLTGYAVCSPAPGTQFTCFTSTLLQMLTPEALRARSPQLALNVSRGNRHRRQSCSTPRQASMLGPAQARAHRQLVCHRRQMSRGAS
jgi:serine/threonine protein kinase